MKLAPEPLVYRLDKDYGVPASDIYTLQPTYMHMIDLAHAVVSYICIKTGGVMLMGQFLDMLVTSQTM